jgi:rod shape-determining protein MreC
VLGAFALAVVLLWQSARDPGKLGAVDRLVLRLVTPLQGGLTRAGGGLVALGHRYLGLTRVEETNVALAKENRLLRATLARLDRAALENVRLSRLLEMRDLLDAPTVPARIVAMDTSPYFRVTRLTIDKGTGRVERGMPVIAPEGVVGRVTRVAGGSADVELAVDPRSVIHVHLPASGGRGLLVGHPGGTGYRCRIQYFTGPALAKVGDQVVTTGLGGFPRDLPVGRVSRVAVPPGSLFQEVDVTPAVDFARLTEVLVLLAPPAEPLPAPSTPHRDGVPTAIPAWPSRGLSFYR